MVPWGGGKVYCINLILSAITYQMVNKKSNELQKIKNYTSCKISFDGDCIILKYYAPSGGGLTENTKYY